MGGESYESALVGELQALAGVAAGTDEFVARVGGQVISVVYKQFSSGPSTLTLEARYDDVARIVPGYRNRPSSGPLVATRPLDIVLRPEDRDDRAAKAQGINVEWQTGDPAFDREVYVSTPTESAEVLATVLGVEARAAVKSLFDLGFRMVGIDVNGVVRAEVTEFVVARPQEGRGRAAMDAFVRLLASLPVVTASGARHAPIPFASTTRALGWTAGIALVVFCLFAIVPAFLHPDPTKDLLGFLALIVGPWAALGLALPVLVAGKKLHGARVTTQMRGSSRAAATGRRAGWTAGLCGWFVVADILHGSSLALLALR